MATADAAAFTSSSPTSPSASKKTFHGRLKVDATFCPPESEVADPFDTVNWEIRTSQIKGEGGEVLFEQTNCEVPTFWSQLATNVICSKYFYGEVGTPEREYSVRQLVHRVSRTITDWGLEDGYFASAADGERFYRDLSWLCLHQHGAFNSPVWFNVGLYHQYGVVGDKCNWRWDPQAQDVRQPENPYEYPQGSACFIQSVGDNMEDIMRLATSEAMLFKFGSGTGSDMSTLRSKREKLSGGGTPSGPLSFMRVYDQIAAVVKSGGKTRRAAKMQSIKVWHPDVMDFIECKWREEQKAQTLIASGKYEANFNGEAYSSVMFQNANLSVRVTDDFMTAYEKDAEWKTRWVTDNTVEGPTYKAREVMDRMADCAWHCGDPGVQYDTTINRWHTCPVSGRINASNPCSEYMFLDDTACNLSSINLMKFRRPADAAGDELFDHERFQAACRVFFIAQEILVDHASYPTADIARNSHLFRPLGLGYSNLGSLLMSSGLPYDSEEGRGVCGAITALLHGAANLTSAELSEAVGAFDRYEENREPMLRVMQMHRDAAEEIAPECPEELRTAARATWDRVIEAGAAHGFRNAQATVLAPTGTISFMMDCDTTGIEPDIALVKYKQLAGGGMLKIINQTVPAALKKLGYDQPEVESILAYIEEEDTIEGAADLRAEHLPVFDCAFTPAGGTRSIPWRAHITMMAAAQPFLSGAISKTVNMPRDTTTDEIAQAYYDGWKLGLKALAIYRDGSKDSQPLNTKKQEGKGKEEETTLAKPRRERLPDTRDSKTHKFSISGHEGYITVGLYDDGRPGELFITMAKEGSTIGGLMDAFGTSVSMSLQYGVPLSDYVRKFSHMRFEPQGHTKNPDIRIAKSLIDYIFRWLGITFLPGYKEASMGLPAGGDTGKSSGDGSAGKGLTELGETKPAAKKAGGQSAGQEATAAKPSVSQPSAKTNGHSSKGTNGHTASAKPQSSASAAVIDELSTKLLERAGAVMSAEPAGRNEQFANFQVDAPSCDNCGSITVRNGNCYLCHNCGNSMGCS
ncbi:Vitamin B12-dependent ribonucleotide reductase [Pseudobythopirellula maris]|uniref:Vitamin B12-dependent ribonucleotide reductase n=1 Tax=Pseudobythopirellula maris TaxID=2527991 RepID=A0A5C5ZVU9_9BACT|nr:vitamin B12-dependent ribonucleotide reductase [Pseudobythopirellula maris]TWT91091.1 Vitamin B12-dependent ribonucleotide reductase [Pseudobythopirellula maris]